MSPANALLQAERIATARGAQSAVISKMMGDFSQGRQPGILGEPRVNVLKMNLELDRSFGKTVVAR